jgi:hypothetical protein
MTSSSSHTTSAHPKHQIDILPNSIYSFSPQSPITATQHMPQDTQMHKTSTYYLSSSQPPPSLSHKPLSLGKGNSNAEPRLKRKDELLAQSLVSKMSGSIKPSYTSTSSSSSSNLLSQMKRSSLVLGQQGAQRLMANPKANSFESFQDQHFLYTALENNREAIVKLGQTYHDGFNALRDMIKEILTLTTQNRFSDNTQEIKAHSQALGDIKASLHRLVQSDMQKGELETQKSTIDTTRHLAISTVLQRLQIQLEELNQLMTSYSSKPHSQTLPTIEGNLTDLMKTSFSSIQAALRELTDASLKKITDAIEKIPSRLLQPLIEMHTTKTIEMAHRTHSSVNEALMPSRPPDQDQNHGSSLLETMVTQKSSNSIVEQEKTEIPNPSTTLDVWFESFVFKLQTMAAARSSPYIAPSSGVNTERMIIVDETGEISSNSHIALQLGATTSSNDQSCSWFEDLDDSSMFDAVAHLQQVDSTKQQLFNESVVRGRPHLATSIDDTITTTNTTKHSKTNYNQQKKLNKMKKGNMKARKVRHSELLQTKTDNENLSEYGFLTRSRRKREGLDLWI